MGFFVLQKVFIPIPILHPTQIILIGIYSYILFSFLQVLSSYRNSTTKQYHCFKRFLNLPNIIKKRFVPCEFFFAQVAFTL